MGTQGEVVRVARLGPSGAWATETVSPPLPAAARLELVARADGAVALAWETAGGEIHAVTGGEGWQPAARLSLPVAVGIGSGHVALPSASGGNVAWAAAWACSGGGIESAALPAGGE
jgi:hypothetical protein